MGKPCNNPAHGFLCRNGVDTEEGIYGITYYGKGRMPASPSHFFPIYN